MFGFGNKDKDTPKTAAVEEKTMSQSEWAAHAGLPSVAVPDDGTALPAASQQKSNPADLLKADLEALGCTVKIERKTTVTVAYDGGDIGGTFNVTVTGDVGSDEAYAIIERAKKDLPLGKTGGGAPAESGVA